jgi:hypothetical protein
MASFQYQFTLNQLLVKTAEFSRRIDLLQSGIDLLQSGFFCSHPRIALFALLRIDIPAASRMAGINILYRHNCHKKMFHTILITHMKCSRSVIVHKTFLFVA